MHTSILALLIKMIASFRWHIALMFLVAIVWAVDLSLRPYLLKVILNRVTNTPEQQIFVILAMPVLAYLLMSFLMSSMFRMYDYFLQYKMMPHLRQKISNTHMHYLLGHSHHYYQNNFSGSLANKVNDLVSTLPETLQIMMDRFFSHGLALIIAIFTLWQVNRYFALVVIIWSTFFIVGSLIYTKKLRHQADNLSEWASTLTGKMVDVLSNILSVRLFARQPFEETLHNETVESVVHADKELNWSYFKMWVVYGYSFVLVQGVSFYLLMRGRQLGEISVGDFALVLSINTAIVDFLWQLTKDFSQFSKNIGKMTQALRTIMLPIEIQDKPNARDLKVTQGEIVFDRVQFNYQGDESLFEDKSVTILSGQKVGLVGFSGSGKSTFVNLILRLFDINQGRILIDGQDIREVTQQSLRAAIGMIPQDPSLFHRSLMDNIRYGKIDATDEEVIKASQRAHTHEFISQLSQGYASLVGERGVKLSGGQRQRIAIARAILKNAPILILDEATSQLDSVTENYIQESLWELMKGKTTIVIAHRLSTLMQMDRILVFEQGKIVEDGNHQTLLATNGRYKTLWDAQVGGFLLDTQENSM